MEPHNLEILYDCLISEHLAEIRRLCEQRNADCSKTRKLPAEILTKIFRILEYSVRNPDWDTLSEWVKVTQVCRTWRSFALNGAVVGQPR